MAKAQLRWLGTVMAAATLFAAQATARPPEPVDGADLTIAYRAMQAFNRGNWQNARAEAATARDPLVAKLVAWRILRMREKTSTFAEISGFLAANPDWAGLAPLRRHGERSMPDTMSASAVVAWFSQLPPITGEGKFRLGAALVATGGRERGNALLREAWTDHDIDRQTENRLLAEFGRVLRPADHWARVDRLLWDDQVTAARRILPHLDEGHRLLAKARIALITGAGGVDAAVARVPPALASDPGLLYQRIRWRRNSGNDSGAAALLMAPPATLGEERQWLTQRLVLTREAISDGRHADAYRIIAAHGQTRAAGVAEAKWLAGWLALRHLNQPRAAFAHFIAMHKVVKLPISVGRAAYWAGRAAKAAGNVSDASLWFQRAASRPTSYYGQLATVALGRKMLRLPPAMRPVAAAGFEAREQIRLARLLGELGEDRLMSMVLAHALDTASTPLERVRIARIPLDYDQSHVAIRAAKKAQRDGVVVLDAAYPVPNVFAQWVPSTGAPELAVMLALARQESEMNPGVVSSAGARGLVQLMPATAKMMARQLGLAYESRRLTSDPAYNLKLGSAYLADRLDEFGGSHVLAFAAYNAGPGRVRTWLRRNGDPRSPGVDVVDWIEQIPFSETRNYVQRVLEGTQVYRVLLAGRGDRPKLTLMAEMLGHSPQ
jgi:soluble lytic murein transglycosylase